MRKPSQKPAVDVIIPAYNSMPWIRYTLESVLSQTYPNYHIYVVDDGSKDGTEAFIKSLKNAKLTYIKQPNGGVSKARNTGIQSSSAPYVAFLDADDIWRKDKLDRQMDVLLKDPTLGLVYGGHYCMDENNIIQRSLLGSHRGDVFEALCTGNVITGSASMAVVPRAVLADVGLFDEDLVNGCEDWEMWLRIAKKYPVDYVPAILAELRVLSNSMQNNRIKMAQNNVQLFDITTKKLALTAHERIVLACTCFTEAILITRRAGCYKLTRQYSRRLLKENPHFLFDTNTWRFHIVPSFFMKGLFSTRFSDSLGHMYTAFFAGVDHFLDRIFSVLSRIINSLHRAETS